MPLLITPKRNLLFFWKLKMTITIFVKRPWRGVWGSGSISEGVLAGDSTFSWKRGGKDKKETSKYHTLTSPTPSPLQISKNTRALTTLFENTSMGFHTIGRRHAPAPTPYHPPPGAWPGLNDEVNPRGQHRGGPTLEVNFEGQLPEGGQAAGGGGWGVVAKTPVLVWRGGVTALNLQVCIEAVSLNLKKLGGEWLPTLGFQTIFLWKFAWCWHCAPHTQTLSWVQLSNFEHGKPCPATKKKNISRYLRVTIQRSTCRFGTFLTLY